MKKSVSRVSVLALLVSLGLTSSYVFAEGNNDNEMSQERATSTIRNGREGDNQQFEVKHESDKNKKEMNSEDSSSTESEMGQEGKGDDSEASLHERFASIPDVKTAITIPEADPATIVTYADVVNLLNQYMSAINQIELKGNVTDVASSSLSLQEKTLLTKIRSKDSFELSRSNIRAQEVASQIKDLTDILIPLGTETISSEFDLKGLLISQLNDFASMINGLADLVDTTTNIIEEETNQ